MKYTGEDPLRKVHFPCTDPQPKNERVYFLLLPSRPRTSRVAERRATHQTPLESRKIPSKLRRGNLMGRTALKSVGKNPKPTGTFRPGAERAKKSRPQEPKNEHILIYQHKSWLPEAMD